MWNFTNPGQALNWMPSCLLHCLGPPPYSVLLYNVEIKIQYGPQNKSAIHRPNTLLQSCLNNNATPYTAKIYCAHTTCATQGKYHTVL